MSRLHALLLSAPLALAACAPSTQSEPDLFERLSAYCGQAFEGQVMSEDPRDEAFASERLVMHVRQCDETELRIPFHVGEDRSRTWVITRLPDDGLRLKHDHRHEDGSEDVLTQYGGDTEGPAGPVRADFPADAESQALFEQENIPVSMENVWSITLTEDSFTYALDRPNRHFSVQFDLSDPVESPPAPWGAE